MIKLAASALLFCFGVSVALPQTDSHFQSGDCPPALLSTASDAAIECGWLHVPERRDAPIDSEIRLFVARLKAKDGAGNAPIVYLAGGPGNAASADFDLWLGSALREQHDILNRRPARDGILAAVAGLPRSRRREYR